MSVSSHSCLPLGSACHSVKREDLFPCPLPYLFLFGASFIVFQELQPSSHFLRGYFFLLLCSSSTGKLGLGEPQKKRFRSELNIKDLVRAKSVQISRHNLVSIQMCSFNIYYYQIPDIFDVTFIAITFYTIKRAHLITVQINLGSAPSFSIEINNHLHIIFSNRSDLV